jgi:predicted nucleotidyltransferase
MIHPAVADHLDEIIEICKEYGVARLELFGSAVTTSSIPPEAMSTF